MRPLIRLLEKQNVQRGKNNVGKLKRKMERLRPDKKSGSDCSHRGSHRHGHRLAWLFSIILIAGCGGLKKATIVSTTAGASAAVATAISGGALAPVAGAMTGAFVADVVTEVGESPSQVIEAPDNLFSLLQKLVEIGGWGIILMLLVPMIIGWILPGPLEIKKKH